MELKGKLSSNGSMNDTLKGKLSSKVSMSGAVSMPINGGTSDYNKLKNIPSIESVELRGNKTFQELGIEECGNQDIINLFR